MHSATLQKTAQHLASRIAAPLITLTSLGLVHLASQAQVVPADSLSLAVSSLPNVQSQVAKWNLSNDDLLIEISGSQKQPAGIYAWNPSNKDKTSFRLIIAGGHRPVWSSHHKRFAYIWGGDIWIADTQGEAARYAPALPASLIASTDPPLQWDWQGRVFSVRRYFGWGATVFRGYNVNEELPVRRIPYVAAWDMAFKEPYVPLARATDSPTWRDLLSTNNATFSPDNRFMAAEVYPTSPLDLERRQSRILIYEFFKWSGDASGLTLQDKENMAKSGRWFLSRGIAIPILGPGRRLTDLGEGTVEVQPLWSPTGEWVAFTLIDLKDGAITPAVIHPDGTNLTKLIDYRAAKRSWENITSIDSIGAPHARVLQWSQDGEYLWMSGGEFNSLEVATFKQGKWGIQSIDNYWGETSGIWPFTFNGARAAYAVSAEMNQQSIQIADLRTKVKDSLILPAGATVEWMSW